MTKEQFIAENLNKLKIDLVNELYEFHSKPAINSKTGRKTEVLELLKKAPMSILELSNVINIKTQNVSSQLTYLRKDGVKIGTNSNGQKFLENHEYVKLEVSKPEPAVIQDSNDDEITDDELDYIADSLNLDLTDNDVESDSVTEDDEINFDD